MRLDARATMRRRDDAMRREKISIADDDG